MNKEKSTTNVLEKWYAFEKAPNPEILQDLLAEDVSFHSPVIHTPQEGKMLTAMYLMAAAQTFSLDNGNFKYVREVINDQHIILEFEAVVEGIIINGIDMMKVNTEGKIEDFKVMVRPIKAVHKLQEKMIEMLQNFSK